jgi:hypothetical protein
MGGFGRLFFNLISSTGDYFKIGSRSHNHGITILYARHVNGCDVGGVDQYHSQEGFRSWPPIFLKKGYEDY